MLIVVLGTMASGSTWIYNVVSGLLAANGRSASRFACESGTHVLRHLPVDRSSLLVKAHGLDRDFLALLAHVDARVVVSRRDARDVVVSQSERFGHKIGDTVKELTASHSSITMLPPGLRVLELEYESEFTATSRTVEALARFLDLPIAQSEMDDLFEALRPERVREKIQGRIDAYATGTFVDHDPSAQWHPNHVGDGRIGKWQHRMDDGTAGAVVAAVGAAGPPIESTERSPFWSSRLFHYWDGRSPDDDELIVCNADRIAVYGPYFFLPAGRWSLEPVLADERRATPATIRIDVNLPAEPERQVAWASWESSRSEPAPTMEFDHENHFEPIEVRVHVGLKRGGAFRFRGVQLRYLGPVGAARGPHSFPIH